MIECGYIYYPHFTLGKMKISIVIPFYNNWDLVHSRLNELYHHVPMDTEIILINDASTENDCAGGFKWWREEGPLNGRLFAYKNKQNMGFGYSVNRGFKIAFNNKKSDAVCLLTSDVTVMSNFIANVDTILSLKTNVLIGGELMFNDTGWNRLAGCGAVPYANGWFLATDKATWDVLGGFDPIYGKFDCEDLDLSTTAWWKGVQLVPANASFRHHSGKTINKYYPDRERYTLHNIQLWRDKWASRADELRIKIYGQ